MFRDRVKIFVKAGNGGNGVIRFDFFHRPTGGAGGDGGNVYLIGVESEFEYAKIKAQKTFKAKNGEHGGKDNQTGGRGEDYYIQVPLVTCVYNSLGEKIGEVANVGEKLLLQKGGRGGLGNYYFRKGGAATLEKYTKGTKIDPIEVTLELEIKSDIIFIGLPNAGKSSILNELTNAHSKVGTYSFTTVNPIIGTTESGLKLLDLPGLITNASSGRGLGTRFEKHTRRTKMVAHFLSIESSDCIKDYLTIRNELKNISENLYNLPEIVVLTKSDEKDKESIKQIKQSIQKYSEVVVVSILDSQSLHELLKTFETKINILNNI